MLQDLSEHRLYKSMPKLFLGDWNMHNRDVSLYNKESTPNGVDLVSIFAGYGYEFFPITIILLLLNVEVSPIQVAPARI